MPQVTEDDLKKVDAAMAGFSKAMLSVRPDAVEAFTRSLGFFEKIAIGKAKLAYEFSGKADPQTRAKKLAAYCESVLPGLKRTFGEAALVKALPPEARTQDVAQICESLGSHTLAGLVRKALQPT